MSSAYAGKSVEPGVFPIKSSLEIETNLASMAASTADEGCIEETVSCLIAAEQCAKCEDPVVRALLSSLVRDEARHAALAWRTVAWALSVGGKNVQERLKAVFAKATATTDASSSHSIDTSASSADLEKFGRLSDSTESKLRRAAMVEVVLPWASCLLAGSSLEYRKIEQLAQFEGAVKATDAIVAAIEKL